MPRPSTYIKRYNAPISGQEALFDTSYRFSFNGKESDSEVKGEGNSLDFGARLYDSRLGRFIAVDPDNEKFAATSPYVFTYNNPLFFIDKNGENRSCIY
jgi:RHS repeat-associated protein